MSPGINALRERGFDVEIRHDAIDDYGPTIFIEASIVTALDIRELSNMWCEAYVTPFNGDAMEWGPL